MEDEILYERKKLPVWGTVRATYRYIGDHLGLLILPTFLFLVFQLGASSVAWTRLSPVWGLLTAIVGFSFAVGIHRTILAGETRGGAHFFHWDRYLWAYTKLSMAVGFAVLVLVFAALWFGRNLVLNWLTQPGKLLLLIMPAFLLATWLTSRLGLAFPAAALGRDRVLARSWQGTRGNSLRIIATGILTLLPVMLVAWLMFLPVLTVPGLANAGDQTRTGLFAAGALIAQAALKALSTLILTAEVSITYRVLCAYQDLSPGNVGDDSENGVGA